MNSNYLVDSLAGKGPRAPWPPACPQTFFEFLPSQKFASVSMVAVKQQIEAAQKRFQSQ
jgi:hypothetical protein